MLLAGLDAFSPMDVFLHAAGWFVYYYLDFSSYSDIAIGGSRLFGFRICENFNFPLFAASIGEFWQRWHMSLAQWCQSYVYMPLIGLTRNPYTALYATMLTIAMWHGASLNWFFWGIYHATGIVVFQKWVKLRRKHHLFVPTRKFDKWVITAGGCVITFAFVATSYIFLATIRFGGYAALRLFVKLVGVDLPAWS